MPHPWVAKATFKDGQIVLAVELDEYLAGESVEISGYVTQNGGGFATVYDLQIATANPDGTVVMYVTANPVTPFQNGRAVTVSLRAARVWVTVLTESEEEQMPPHYSPAPDQQGPVARDGTSWSHMRAVGWASPSPFAMPRADQTSAGSGSSFQGR